MIDFNLAADVIISTLIAYLMGALPIAVWISRRRGVNIFNVGTGLPGASNVRRQVGNVPGGLVLIGDMAKGAIAAIVAARLIGDDQGLWLLLPCFAMVVGHWRSIFTGFRGGDGLAPLGGAILVMFPPFNGFLAVLIGSLVMLGGQKLPYTSLLGLVVAVAVLLLLTASNTQQLPLAVGVGVIASGVLLHASVGHKRRNSDVELDQEDADDAEGVRG